MAVRLNRLHQESVKAKIRASQLINRLQNHVLGKVEMSSTQIKAADILLSKVISDAPRILAGDSENPLIPADGFRPTQLPREALIAIASGRKAYYKDGELVIEDAPPKTNGHATNGSADGSVH